MNLILAQIADRGGVAKRASAPSCVVLLIDASGSMAGNHKLSQAKSGAKGCAQMAFESGGEFALIQFHCGAEVLLPPSRDLASANAAIDAMRASGGTNLAQGFKLAGECLSGRTGKRLVLLVTDGWPNNESAALQAAEDLKAAGIDIEARGVDCANFHCCRGYPRTRNPPPSSTSRSWETP